VHERENGVHGSRIADLAERFCRRSPYLWRLIAEQLQQYRNRALTRGKWGVLDATGEAED
jgi:hypothetical protein